MYVAETSVRCRLLHLADVYFRAFAHLAYVAETSLPAVKTTPSLCIPDVNKLERLGSAL